MTSIHFRFVRTLMIFCGTWRIKFRNGPKMAQKVYDIFSYIPQLFFFIFVFSFVVDLPFIWNKGVHKIMENLGVLFLCIIMWWKMIIAQTADVTNLLEYLLIVEEDIQASLIKEDKKVYYKNAKRVTYIAFSLTFYTFVLVGLPLILLSFLQYLEFERTHPFPNSTDEKPLPYINWFPFDKNEHYAVALGIDILGAFYGSTYNIFTQIFFITLLSFISTKLSILQNHFRTFHLRKTKNEDEMLKVLKGLILEHESVIE